MILQSLRDLAVREGLVDDPAFESKPVRWVVRLKADGGFVGVYDTNQTPLAVEGKKGKPRPEALMMLIPRRKGRQANISADFLVDKAEYSLGIVPAGEEAGPKTPLRLKAFMELLTRAAESTHSVELKSVQIFLSDTQALSTCAKKLDQQGDFATNDLFCFEVDGEYVQDVETLKSWWRQSQILPLVSEDDMTVQCLMCGSPCSPVEKHNQIQIAGGVTAGVPLVSFNSDAFEKYGWERNKNAPICNKCMTAYVEGLRRLTRQRYVLPQTGRTVGPLNTRLTDDTTAVYWADAESELVSMLPFLREDPKKVKDLLASPHRGGRVSVGAAHRFFCLILSGAQGRAVVRKIHTGTVGEVEANLMRYFAAIDVERFDRSAPIPLYRLLQSIVLQGKLDRLPPELGSELWLASLFGHPLSRLFLATLIARNCAERAVTPERAALLQFYFEGRKKLDAPSTPSSNDVARKAKPMSLDPENKDAPYLLGRLLAVLESLQTAAQGQGLNRTIVDRFYGSASTRPGVVFPQLLKLSKHHLSKAGKKAEGRSNFLDRELGNIVNGIQPGGFSATLNLEQQGNFALGYYHQRQSFYKKKELAPVEGGQTNETSTQESGESHA